VAKSRAQRKAEQRKRRQQELEERARRSQAKAQHDTQVPESGEVAEVEAALEAGAAAADEIDPDSSVPAEGVEPATPAAAAEVGEPAGQRPSRREQRRAEKERERKARESAERRAPKEEKPERQRGRVMSFFASVIAELRKVQWPDRETLIQASAVTLIFVAVAAAYLGALDAIFGWLVDRLIT